MLRGQEACCHAEPASVQPGDQEGIDIGARSNDGKDDQERRQDQGRQVARFGSHMSIAGGCDRAVRAAGAVGFETVQLFTKNNNQWNAPPLTDEHVAAFRRGPRRDGDRRPGRPHVVPDQSGQPRRRPVGKIDRGDGRRGRALRGCWASPTWSSIPAPIWVQGEEAGVARIAQALDRVHRRTEGLGVMIDLETTAGQGTNLGYRFEHLRDILDRVQAIRAPGRVRGYLPYFRGRLFPGDAGRSTMKRSTGSTGPWG